MTCAGAGARRRPTPRSSQAREPDRPRRKPVVRQPAEQCLEHQIRRISSTVWRRLPLRRPSRYAAAIDDAPRPRPRSRCAGDLGRFGCAASTSPLQLLQLRLDVVAGDLAVGHHGAALALMISCSSRPCATLRDRTNQTSAATMTSSDHDDDRVRHPRPVAVHQPAAVSACSARSSADREEDHARADAAPRRPSPKPTYAPQALERIGRLLLGVRDDEVLQLAHCLLGVVGHSSPVGSGARVSSRARPDATTRRGRIGGSSRQRGAGTRSRASGSSRYRPIASRDLILQALARRRSRSRRWRGTRSVRLGATGATGGSGVDDAGQADDAVDVPGLGPQPARERGAAEPAGQRAGLSGDREAVDDRREPRLRAERDDAEQRRARDAVVGREARTVVQHDARRSARRAASARSGSRASRPRSCRAAHAATPSSRVEQLGGLVVADREHLLDDLRRAAATRTRAISRRADAGRRDRDPTHRRRSPRRAPRAASRAVARCRARDRRPRARCRRGRRSTISAPSAPTSPSATSVGLPVRRRRGRGRSGCRRRRARRRCGARPRATIASARSESGVFGAAAVLRRARRA